MEITRTSSLTGVERTKDLNISPIQLTLWKNGMLAQRAFPQLSPEDREFIISGCTKEEWDEAFKNIED